MHYFDFSCRAGIHLPTLEVKFKGVSVDAQVYKGDRALPTILNSYRNLVEVGLNLSIVPGLSQLLCILKNH